MNKLFLIVILIVILVVIYFSNQIDYFTVIPNNIDINTDINSNYTKEIQVTINSTDNSNISRNNPLPIINSKVISNPNIFNFLPINDELPPPEQIDSSKIIEIDNKLTSVLKESIGKIINSSLPTINTNTNYTTKVLDYVNPTDLDYIKNSFIKYINNIQSTYTFSILDIPKKILSLIQNNKGNVIKQYKLYMFLFEKNLLYTKRVIVSILTTQNASTLGTITIENIVLPENAKLDTFNILPINKSNNNITNDPSFYKIDNILGLGTPFNESQDIILTESLSIEEAKRQKKLKNLESSYMCFGTVDSANISNKLDCLNFGGVWDTQPKTDTECPYFNANKNYYNTLGGMNEGKYCTFPSGIEIIGYTNYSKDPRKFNPQCYNCKTDLIGQGTIGTCCDKQNNKTDYPLLKSPDYKFPGDQQDRYNSRYELSTLKLSYN